MQVRATYGAVGDVYNGILWCGDSGFRYFAQPDRFRARPDSRLHLLTGVGLIRRGKHRSSSSCETDDTEIEGKKTYCATAAAAIMMYPDSSECSM